MTQPPLGRLSVRRGLSDDDVLYEGVPEHLQGIVREWAFEYLGVPRRPRSDDEDEWAKWNKWVEARSAFLLATAVRCRVPVEDEDDALRALVLLITSDEDTFLDVVDLHLQMKGGGREILESYLAVGGSAWMVASEPVPHLERRVLEEQRAQLLDATSVPDDATTHLRVAWAKVYGRDPDPSDAWDHAIKAVETLLHPLVSPKNRQATLGTMLRDLKAKPDKWTVGLGSSATSGVETFNGMLRLVWPNPDRHGSGSSRRPEQSEAEQVLGLAVLLVSWLRAGVLQPRVPLDPWTVTA